jgi:hypothetical protein
MPLWEKLWIFDLFHHLYVCQQYLQQPSNFFSPRNSNHAQNVSRENHTIHILAEHFLGLNGVWKYGNSCFSKCFSSRNVLK